jgi:hypothetical protein
MVVPCHTAKEKVRLEADPRRERKDILIIGEAMAHLSQGYELINGVTVHGVAL